MAYPPNEAGYPATAFPLEPFDSSFVFPRRPRKFQSRLWLHIVLLILTIGTTTFAGALHYAGFLAEFSSRTIDPSWGLLLHGFWYSGTLLGILGAHEMGHYVLCRRYNVDATLPYFIPTPPFLFLTGTLGAVIKIREAFPTRRVLFDIGVAGPIAGFVLLVPALFLGMSLSNVVPVPTAGDLIYLGEPLLFKAAIYIVFGSLDQAQTVNMHPMVFAAWFGMMATALNLLPFGQLDGGHITYATLGRWSTPISIATVAIAIVMTFISISWLVMTVLMVAMLLMFGARHPRVIHEHEPIGPHRAAVAVLALIIFVLCFTPVPIRI
ncbi:MAG: site-2 protease family protein [Acidobacteriota bacterium]|nr:site-2 protease family protein [Acidobacteriota bacterium]